MLRRIIILLTVMSVIIPAGAKTLTGSQVLDEAAKRIKTVRSITATYDISDGQQTSAGTLVMAGEKFHLSSPDLMAWYDGNTQWTFMPSSNEVNIVEPTPEELAQVNPFVIISSFRKAYKAVSLKAPSGKYKVALTPTNARGAYIKKAMVTFNASSFMPERIKLTTDNGTNMAIRIKTLKTGTNYPVSTFVFNKKQYPKAEIIDLR